tara:strand:- start:1234 stop:1824 length:591 start_codon:yes stop_codon:yes gene_type:complete
MFNGIIYNQGIVTSAKKRKKGLNFFIKSNLKVRKKDIGMSISCDGVCLTLTSVKNKISEFYLSNETLKKSRFRNIKIGNKINLEKPLEYKQKISGHICQGHVDFTSKLLKKTTVDKSKILEFKINKKQKTYLIEKASISVNGVSLTISKVLKNSFQIWVIPHTIKLTNLSNLKIGDIVNIEIDILSKYVKKFIYEK